MYHPSAGSEPNSCGFNEQGVLGPLLELRQLMLEVSSLDWPNPLDVVGVVRPCVSRGFRYGDQYCANHAIKKMQYYSLHLVAHLPCDLLVGPCRGHSGWLCCTLVSP